MARRSYKRAMGTEATGTRIVISTSADFVQHFLAAKIRVRSMEFRYVVVPEPALSTVFEVYASIALGTEGDFNLFETH